MTTPDKQPEPSNMAQDDSMVDASVELPVVILGETIAQEGEAPRERLLPGRVPTSMVFYPIYLLLILSGGLAGNAALDTGEWSFWLVIIAWCVMFFWNWIYVVSWTYRRALLKTFCVLWLFVMEGSMAFVCYDRSLPQHIFRNKLVYRDGIPSLKWASILLLVCLALFLIHLVFLGRGYRKKTHSEEGSTS